MAKPISLSGTVTYRERIALPPSAVIDVQLLDVSLADAPAVIIARSSMRVQRQVPIRYRLRFDDTHIDPKHTYVLRAEITVDGQLWFTTTTQHRLQAEGLAGGVSGPGNTDIVVERVGDSPRAGTSLPEGRWLAENIRGGGVIDRLQSVLEIASNGAISGSGGCNRLTSKAVIRRDKIAFGRIASTFMACPPAAMDQESKFFAALRAVRGWRIDRRQQKLALIDGRGRPVIVLAKM